MMNTTLPRKTDIEIMIFPAPMKPPSNATMLVTIIMTNKVTGHANLESGALAWHCTAPANTNAVRMGNVHRIWIEPLKSCRCTSHEKPPNKSIAVIATCILVGKLWMISAATEITPRR
jgi:hypothetical protein